MEEAPFVARTRTFRPVVREETIPHDRRQPAKQVLARLRVEAIEIKIDNISV